MEMFSLSGRSVTRVTQRVTQLTLLLNTQKKHGYKFELIIGQECILTIQHLFTNIKFLLFHLKLL